jgi:lipoate-protein ligase A
MYLILNESTSPYFNLALEEYLLAGTEIEAIVLWRNSRAVIVGVHQNTMEEVDLDYIRERCIPVVRRQSGGGAVFHDLGNVNFTVIRNLREGDFDNYSLFTLPIVGFLASLGVHAELQGRNDLTINGAKFCGNAQAVKGKRIMHHGCILYSADFSDLSRALKPVDAKFESHGVKSVRKRVTNIADHMENPMPVEEFFARMGEFFARRGDEGSLTPYSLTAEDVSATQKLADEKYASWNWNFGKSPAYNMKRVRRYAFGIVDVRLSVEEGVIRDIHVYGDFFGLLDKAELEEKMKGLRHERSVIRAAAGEVGQYIQGITADEWAALIC